MRMTAQGQDRPDIGRLVAEARTEALADLLRRSLQLLARGSPGDPEIEDLAAEAEAVLAGTAPQIKQLSLVEPEERTAAEVIAATREYCRLALSGRAFRNRREVDAAFLRVHRALSDHDRALAESHDRATKEVPTRSLHRAGETRPSA
jgi:hypothetical protein